MNDIAMLKRSDPRTLVGAPIRVGGGPQGVGPTEMIAFGAGTLVGSGAAPTSLPDGPYGQFAVSGGVITPTVTPLTPGTTDHGTTRITVQPDILTVASVAEAELAAATLLPAQTATIRFRNGDHSGGARLNLDGLQMTSGQLTVDSEGARGAIVPGVSFIGSQNIRFEGLILHRDWLTSADDAAFVCVGNGPGITFFNCKVSSNAIATATYGDPPEMLQGVGTPDSTPLDSFLMQGCLLHDLSEGFRLGGDDMVVAGNYFRDCYANFGKLFAGTGADAMNNLTFVDNYGYGIWARSSGGTPEEVAEDPHSALFGMVTLKMNGGTVRGNAAFVGSRRVSQGDGLYGLARGWGWDDPGAGNPADFPLTESYENVTRDHNVWGVNMSTALAKGYYNSSITHETYVVDPMTVGPGASTGCSFNLDRDHGLTTRFIAGATVDLLDQSTVDDATVAAAHANVAINYSASTSVLEEAFAGPFGSDDITPENFQTRLAPVPGGPLGQWDRTVGAVGTGAFTWATGVGTAAYVPGVYTAPAAYSKPAPTRANGAALAQVRFEAADHAVSNGAPFGGFSNTGFTMQFGIAFPDDGTVTEQHLCSTGGDIRVRRAAGGEMQFRIDMNTGHEITISSARPHLASDGSVLYTIAADVSTGKVMLMRGARLEGIVITTTGFGGTGTWNTSNTTLVVGGDNLGSSGGQMDFSHLWMGPYVDLEDPANMDRFVALDGLPAPLGGDGSVPTGVQPPIYLAGDAADWNAGGLNLGGNGVTWSMGAGTVTDVGADVTAPALSAATDSANGSTAMTGSVTTDEGNGTLYTVVSTSATTPSAAQIAAGQDHTGTGAPSTSQAVSATGAQAVALSGLTASTAYVAHFMHEDAAGNRSAVISADGFTTDTLSSYAPGFLDNQATGGIEATTGAPSSVTLFESFVRLTPQNIGPASGTKFIFEFGTRCQLYWSNDRLRIRLEDDAGVEIFDAISPSFANQAPIDLHVMADAVANSHTVTTNGVEASTANGWSVTTPFDATLGNGTVGTAAGRHLLGQQGSNDTVGCHIADLYWGATNHGLASFRAGDGSPVDPAPLASDPATFVLIGNSQSAASLNAGINQATGAGAVGLSISGTFLDV